MGEMLDSENSTAIEKSKNRNYAIDLLRCVSMGMITIHHVLLHGGILEGAQWLSPQYSVSWLLEIASLCAVNVYGLISGYVGFGKRNRYSRIIFLCLQVSFYTIISTVVLATLGLEIVNIGTIRNAIFPFAYDTYWYFNAYFCLFFMMPFLNKLVSALSEREIKCLLVTMLFVFSVLQTLLDSQFALTNNGYSFLWLALMYITGASIRKLGIEGAKLNCYLQGYFLSVLIMWFTRMGIENVAYKISNTEVQFKQFVTYTSPFMVICAICLVIAFAKMELNRGCVKATMILSPVAFDVYLLQDEPHVRNALISGAFVKYLYFQPGFMVLAILETALVIFTAGIAVGSVRTLVFKALKVEEVCEKMEAKLLQFYQRVL